MAAKSQSRAPEGVSFNVQYEKKHEASFGGMRPGLTRAKTMTTAAFSRGVAALEGAEYVHRKLRRQPPKPPKNPALEWVPLVEEAGHEMQKEPTHAELRNMDLRRKSLLRLARETVRARPPRRPRSFTTHCLLVMFHSPACFSLQSAIDTLIKLKTLGRTVLPRLCKKPLIWFLIVPFAISATLARSGVLTDDQLIEASTLQDTGGHMVTFMVVFYVGCA